MSPSRRRGYPWCHETCWGRTLSVATRAAQGCREQEFLPPPPSVREKRVKGEAERRLEMWENDRGDPDKLSHLHYRLRSSQRRETWSRRQFGELRRSTPGTKRLNLDCVRCSSAHSGCCLLFAWLTDSTCFLYTCVIYPMASD